MIKDEIQKNIITALKEKKETELKVFRFVLSQIQYEEINKQKELTDEEVVVVLQKEVKKRKDAIEMFKKGERFDLVEDEEKQLQAIAKYLPEQMSDEEINTVIEEVLSSLPEAPNMGNVMARVMARIKGRTEGNRVSQLVKQKLQL